jgi:hypothetical protein
MKQWVLILVSFFILSPSWGQAVHSVRKGQKTQKVQRVEIVDQNENFTMDEKQEEFYYIEKEFPLSNDRWLATLDGFCTNTQKSTLEDLFLDFWETANTLGANSFFIDDFFNTPDTTFVTISVFNLTESELDANYELYPHNRIYVFGDMVRSKATAKGQTIKFNSEKIILYPLKYYTYQNAVGEESSVSIGGIFGSKYVLEGKEDNLPVYLSFGGLKVAPALHSGGVGLNFSSGSIYPFFMNFGQFLVEILEENRQ